MSSSVARSLVGGREVYLCDHICDEVTVSRVSDLLKTLLFRRVERSRGGSDVSGGSAEIPEHVAQSEPLFGQLRAFVEECFGVRGVKAQRLYVNSTVFGDMYYPHRDFDENEPHVTVLYYANPSWNVDWGGETILYDDVGDAQIAISPRPGRVLAFRGAILHRGGVPTRICYEERLTIAYKLRFPDSASGADPTHVQSTTVQKQAGPPRGMAEAVAEVSAAISANDLDRASRIAEQSLSTGLAHPTFYNACALKAEREGNDENALAWYEQARTLAPRNAQLLNSIGLCLIRLSRFQEAVYVFEQAIRIAPAEAATHHRLGLALGRNEQWDLAERAHARAAQLDPRHAEAIAHLALIAARRGDQKTAQNHAERALRLDAANATAREALEILASGNAKT